MCGIIGIIGKKSRDIEYISKLNNLQYHRGPDSNGVYQDINSNVALAMTRLAIIDIVDGNQPFAMNNEELIIIFNGEIYNNLELRKELEKEGVVFETNHSEVEVIGALFKKYGENMLEKLNGMFALAIYDKIKQQIFIARDRFGIKPLYFYNDKNNFFFSSELKVLVECFDDNLEINDQSIVDYFSLGYTQTPNTIYKNIHQLSPAHWLKFSLKSYSVEKKRWWKTQFTKNRSISNNNDWPILIREGLEDAVKRWATSDVSIAYLLSGGLDSSAIVTLAAQMSSKRIRTYTLGFMGDGEESWNEIFIARDVAKKINSDHTEIILEPKYLVDDINMMVNHLDQPYGGGLPSWEIFKQISKNEKVVVNGTGADEIFGNYNRGNFLLDCLRKEKQSGLFKEVKFEHFLKHFKSRISINKEVDLENVIETEGILNIHNTAEWIFKLYNECKDLDLEDKLTKVTLETQMTDEFLMMTDRFSMAHSLEARTPFLDHEFVNLVLSIPTEIKVDNKLYKSMLRKAVGEFLPKSVLKAKKRGFSIPLSLWMRKLLKPLVMDLLNPSSLKKGGYLKPTFYDKYVKPMLEGDNNHISLIWSALMFQLWITNIHNK